MGNLSVMSGYCNPQIYTFCFTVTESIFHTFRYLRCVSDLLREEKVDRMTERRLRVDEMTIIITAPLYKPHFSKGNVQAKRVWK